MEYKFKKKITVSSGEFWYDLKEGYLKPTDYSKDQETIKAIEEALQLLKTLEEMTGDE